MLLGLHRFKYYLLYCHSVIWAWQNTCIVHSCCSLELWQSCSRRRVWKRWQPARQKLHCVSKCRHIFWI